MSGRGPRSRLQTGVFFVGTCILFFLGSLETAGMREISIFSRGKHLGGRIVKVAGARVFAGSSPSCCSPFLQLLLGFSAHTSEGAAIYLENYGCIPQDNLTCAIFIGG